MHEVKQRVKEKLQAGAARVSSDTAADDALADTRLSGLESEAHPSAPATARSMTGEIVLINHFTGTSYDRHTHTHTHTHIRLMAFFQDNLGEPAPER